MYNHKKILKWIIILTIIMMIVLIMILLINNTINNEKEQSNWIDTTVDNDGVYPESEELKYEEVAKLTDADDFATIYTYIKNYITYYQNKEEIKIKNITDAQYTQKDKLEYSQFDNTKKFIVNSAYYENEKLTITRYYVFGVNKQEINGNYIYNNIAFIVRCDYDNMTFSIVPIFNVNEDDIQQIRNNYRHISNDIIENEDNILKFNRMKDEDIVDIYVNKYIYNCLHNSEETYNNLLNEEYKNGRFGNLQQYKSYIELIKEKIINFEDSIYQKNETEKYNKYIIKDNYNNYYVIIEKGFLDYTIMLDNYTILDENYIQKYNSLDNKSKAHTNIDMFIKMINTKDYQHAYEKLDNTFKANNFGTIENFIEYIKSNFYDNNLLEVDSVEQKNDIYIVNVRLQSDNSNTREEMKKSFVVKLGEDTDFTMSFNVN